MIKKICIDIGYTKIKSCFFPVSGLILFFMVGFLYSQKIDENNFLTYREYYQKQIEPPYIIEINRPKGSLLYIGVSHTANPEDPQIKTIIDKWNEFNPTLTFSEGGVWGLEINIETAVRKHGEGGLLRYLAAMDSVPIRNIDLGDAALVELLKKDYTAEQIKLFTILQYIPQYFRLQTEQSFSAYVMDAIRALSKKPGLEGFPRDLAELAASIELHLPELANWRYVDTRWISPLDSLAFTNEIARLSGYYRNRHIANSLIESVEQGERVFAVSGLTHVVMQEPVIRKALGEK